MNPIKSQREWTPREIAELKKLRREGVAYAEIARQLNRSQKAIGSAVYKFDAQAMRSGRAQRELHPHLKWAR